MDKYNIGFLFGAFGPVLLRTFTDSSSPALGLIVLIAWCALGVFVKNKFGK